MTHKHKGFALTFNEDRDIWQADVNGEMLENKQFGNLKLAIDRLLKGDFKRVKVYYASRWDHDLVEVELTSYDGREFWMIDKNKRRGKVRGDDLYEISEHNKALMRDIRELDRQIRTLENAREKASEKMKRIDEEQFKKKIDKAA